MQKPKLYFDRSNPYIIAEIGANHNGDMQLARQMIQAAKACGCDAVKFQSWTPESLISKGEYDRNQKYDDSPKKHFGSLREMVDKYYLREEQHHELSDFCKREQIDFCSTPFSKAEVDLLQRLDVPFFKIASMDVNHPDLIAYIAQYQKPILLSTGMASLDEIEKAVRVIEKAGNNQIVLLHCVSIYPPAVETIHLQNLKMLANTFGYPVGFSDHTTGTTVPIAATAIGAVVIEKHFTLDKDLPGWDHEISADPAEMKQLVSETQTAFKALGNYRRTVSSAEIDKRKKFRRSIVAKRDLPEGIQIGVDQIDYKRPGNGISPDEACYVIGRTTRKKIVSDRRILWEDLI